MSRDIKNILSLTDALAAHENVTHWAISMRITTKGDFLNRLKLGADCRSKTIEAVMEKLAAIWPADLEWPRDIERPKSPKKKKVAA